MIKLRGSHEATSVSVDGKEYLVKDGIVEVPEEAVSMLCAFGFRKYVEKKDERKTLHLRDRREQ